MTNKVMFESKSGSKQRGAIWHNLQNCDEFAVTVRSLTDPFNTFMKKVSKQDKKSERFQNFPTFQGLIHKINLIASRSSKQLNSYVLNNNFFYPQVAFTYILDNTDVFFLFLIQ